MKEFKTALGTHVFVEQSHYTQAPRLGLRPTRGSTLEVDAVLSTEETCHLIEMLVQTLPPISAYELTANLAKREQSRASRAKRDRLRKRGR
jgi:hypothetical protein